MTSNSEATRLFRVYARHLDHHHARLLEETSFEAAAVAYVEGLDVPAPVDDDAGLRLIVHDVGSGHEHCFKLDLETGETSPCG